MFKNNNCFDFCMHIFFDDLAIHSPRFIRMEFKVTFLSLLWCVSSFQDKQAAGSLAPVPQNDVLTLTPHIMRHNSPIRLIFGVNVLKGLDNRLTK